MSKKFIIMPLAAALIAAAPALAQQVGTATAVNPVSESTPPGGATDKLTVARACCTRNASTPRRPGPPSCCFSTRAR